MATSKSMKPPSTRVTRSSDPTTSAPAARAASAASPAAKTATRTLLPVPDGQRNRAPQDLVCLTGVDAQAHSELNGLVEAGMSERF